MAILNPDEILYTQKTIMQILAESDVRFVQTGSRAFGYARPDSDHDFFVEMSKELAKFLSDNFHIITNDKHVNFDGSSSYVERDGLEYHQSLTPIYDSAPSGHKVFTKFDGYDVRITKSGEKYEELKYVGELLPWYEHENGAKIADPSVLAVLRITGGAKIKNGFVSETFNLPDYECVDIQIIKPEWYQAKSRANRLFKNQWRSLIDHSETNNPKLLRAIAFRSMVLAFNFVE